MSNSQIGVRRGGPSGVRRGGPSGPPKHLCQRCRDRKARFQYRGEVRADRDHTLCFECYRSERERRRAHVLADIEAPRPLRSPFAKAPLISERQVAHRTVMLAHLDIPRARSQSTA
jgi:hypothetical protein